MRFSFRKTKLQEYAVYCFNPSECVKTYYDVMAISPEDAYHQLAVMGFEPISWVSEGGYGDY